MGYARTLWHDHVPEYPGRYTEQDNGDGTVTLVPYGRIIQSGTPISAQNLNHLETGVADSYPRLMEIDIAPGEWTADGARFKAELTEATVTPDTVCEFDLSGTVGNLKADLDWQTATGKIFIRTSVKPSGNLTGHIILTEGRTL